MTLCIAVLSIWVLILILSDHNGGAREFVQAVNKEMKSRTIFTALFFGALVYCVLHNIKIPDLLNTIVSTLLGYWYGQGKSQQAEGGSK